MKQRTSLLASMLICTLGASHAFLHSVSPRHLTNSRGTALRGIHEWREAAISSNELQSEVKNKNENNRRQWHVDGDSFIIREIPVLVTGSHRVALQGENIYLQFTTDSEVRLFQQAIDCHHSIFGLGFLSLEENIIYDKISLVEIEDYKMMGDEFGIFLSAKVVGRADMLAFDDSSKDEALEERDVVPAMVSEICHRKEPLSLSEVSQLGSMVEQLIAKLCTTENESEMLLFGSEQDRWDRYQEAYRQALESDSLDYLSLSSDETDDANAVYSWKELNAISWAAFSTNECLARDETYRLAALDNDCLTNRLKLAAYWLSDVLLDVSQAR